MGVVWASIVHGWRLLYQIIGGLIRLNNNKLSMVEILLIKPQMQLSNRNYENNDVIKILNRNCNQEISHVISDV